MIELKLWRTGDRVTAASRYGAVGVYAGLIAVACGQDRLPRAACSQADTAWVKLAATHGQAYPLLEAADIYKLVHQGLAGPGHAAPSRSAAAAWLASELAGLESGDGEHDGASDERLFVPVRPDSTIVRVNLRPWIEAGRDTAALLDAFLATADALRPNPEVLATEFEAVARCLVGAARLGELPIDANAIEEVFSDGRDGGYPPRHHSPAYEAAYLPAYRVVEVARVQ